MLLELIEKPLFEFLSLGLEFCEFSDNISYLTV